MLLHFAAMAYFIALGARVDELLTPVGAQSVALGMILVGVATLRAKVWHGWQAFTPFVVGLYFYMVPFFGFILMDTGKPPYTFRRRCRA